MIEKKSLWLQKDKRGGERLVRVVDLLPNSVKPATIVIATISVDGLKPLKARITKMKAANFEKLFVPFAPSNSVAPFDATRVDDPLVTKIRSVIDLDKRGRHEYRDDLLDYARDHMGTLLDLAESLNEFLNDLYVRTGNSYPDAEEALLKLGIATKEQHEKRFKQRHG